MTTVENQRLVVGDDATNSLSDLQQIWDVWNSPIDFDTRSAVVRPLLMLVDDASRDFTSGGQDGRAFGLQGRPSRRVNAIDFFAGFKPNVAFDAQLVERSAARRDNNDVLDAALAEWLDDDLSNDLAPNDTGRGIHR